MLKKIVGTSRKVVSIDDPSVRSKLTQSELMRYTFTRDYSIIEKHDFTANPPTIFTVRPLATKHEALAEMPLYLFAVYVEGVENADQAMTQFVERDGQRILTDEACELYSREVRQEIGTVVAQLASRDGEYRPFSLPDTYQDLGNQRRQLTVLNAAIGTAKQTPSS